jgi:hypothetical protein
VRLPYLLSAAGLSFLIAPNLQNGNGGWALANAVLAIVIALAGVADSITRSRQPDRNDGGKK